MEVSANELRELIAAGACAKHNDPCESPSRKIVIGQRGWVWVGDVSVANDWTTLTNASVIRVWGTDKGLGQLAKSGPTSKTVLDKCGTVRIPTLAIVGMIDLESGVSLGNG